VSSVGQFAVLGTGDGDAGGKVTLRTGRTSSDPRGGTARNRRTPVGGAEKYGDFGVCRGHVSTMSLRSRSAPRVAGSCTAHRRQLQWQRGRGARASKFTRVPPQGSALDLTRRRPGIPAAHQKASGRVRAGGKPGKPRKRPRRGRWRRPAHDESRSDHGSLDALRAARTNLTPSGLEATGANSRRAGSLARSDRSRPPVS